MLIPIYELTKKRARFKWTDTQQKAFDDIKKLLVKPPILRMVSGEGIFRLESDTSRTAAGGTLYQWQDQKWVLVGYHSKKLPVQQIRQPINDRDRTTQSSECLWLQPWSRRQNKVQSSIEPLSNRTRIFSL